MTGKLFVFHGHFYQPPRENPWTGLISRERSAAPYHDWNRRIDEECYRPNAFGRIVDDGNEIRAIVNNYAHMSFNVGPTLLRWLAEYDPLTLRRMIEADRRSAERNGGHGNAIAQAYNHIILPLADRRDRRTQIEWGLKVFQHYFQREAEAMWLPETAADHHVLDELIERGLRYVILAPQQAARVRPLAGGSWEDVRGGIVDTSMPYLYRHRDGSSGSIAVFFYDGELAQRIAFGDALHDSARFRDHVVAAARRCNGGPLVHAAADGETAGHHHAWGDRVLAHALFRLLPDEGIEVTNYGHALDLVPPTHEVELELGPEGEGSSWSCPHGVGRWIRDCGCSIAHTEGWNQRWRTGLRKAFDLLRDRARDYFEEEASTLLQDPWAARDAYVEVLLDRSPGGRAAFLEKHGRGNLSEDMRIRALSLLEMQHHLLLQYTSCGWFFDDIGGLEARQVLRYAARAVDLWTELGGDPPARAFLDFLSQARSNLSHHGHGAAIFREIATGDTVDPRQILVHALLRAQEEDRDAGSAGEWGWSVRHRECHEHDGRILHTGQVVVEQSQTGRTYRGAVAVLQQGDLDLDGRVQLEMSEEDFRRAGRSLGAALVDGEERAVLDQEFTDLRYDVTRLLSAGGRELLAPIIERSYRNFQLSLSRLHREHRQLLTGVHELGLDDPELLEGLARISLEAALRVELEDAIAQPDEAGRESMRQALEEARGAGIELDLAALRPRLESALEDALLRRDLSQALRLLALSHEAGIPVLLFRAQERFVEIAADLGDREKARRVGRKLGLSDGLIHSLLGGGK